VQAQNRRAAEAFLSRAGTESGTPAAFLTALRVNDHRAYSLTSPHLHYKIDEWLLTHEPGPLCRWRDDGGEIYTTTGFADRHTIRFQCVTTEGMGYIFEVRGLRIAETSSGAFQITGWTGINETEVPVLSESVTR
jgi:hypothetical protein